MRSKMFLAITGVSPFYLDIYNAVIKITEASITLKSRISKQLRLFTIHVGGYTPLEKHTHENEVFILRGKALVRGGNNTAEVKPGHVIFIESNEEHQFRNIGDEPVEFLCTKQMA